MFSRSAFTLGRVLLKTLQRNQKRIALTSIPLLLFSTHMRSKFVAEESHTQEQTVEVESIPEPKKIVPYVEHNGNILLCHKNDIKEGEIKLFECAGNKILLAKVDDEIHACNAISPVDNKTLLDSSLLIGDKIYDIVNGAIFSIKEGVTEYSPNLELLKKWKVVKNENGTVSVKITNDKPAFDTLNMRGWVPEFTDIVILGSGFESLNIARSLRQSKYRGFITLMFGEDIQHPYDRSLLFEDLDNLENGPIRDKEFYDQFQIKVSKNKDKVKYINIDEQIIKTQNVKEDPVTFQKLVYALGSRPRFVGIIGLGLSGIYQPFQLSDFKQIKQNCASFKKVVIVGDTINSIHLANNLRKNSKADITLVTESESALNSLKIGEEVNSTIVQELEKNGIHVISNASITGAFGEKSVEKITLQDGKELQCDSLFLMREEFPNVDSCESSMRLSEKGAFYTDSYQRTVSSEIWALGPTASIIAPFIATPEIFTNPGDILLQAHSTALNLMDKRHGLRTIPFQQVKVGNVKLNMIGFLDQSTRYIINGDTQKNDYVTYYFRGDQLVGAASPSRFRDLAIVREALYQDIIPRGTMNINPSQLLQNILQLKPSKLRSDVLASMNKTPHSIR